MIKVGDKVYIDSYSGRTGGEEVVKEISDPISVTTVKAGNHLYNLKTGECIHGPTDTYMALPKTNTKTPMPEVKPPKDNNKLLKLSRELATITRRLVGGKDFTTGQNIKEATISALPDLLWDIRCILDEYDKVVMS